MFLIGKKSREEVRTLYKEHQFYIQYSISEGFCNAVLEAQAMQLLCIVSDAEGLSENVINNATGWVVPKKNPNLLVNKLKDVFSLPDNEKEKIKIEARKRVVSNFNIEKQQKNFVGFYKD